MDRPVNILHTESSNGWGGQEIRTLREAEGMREKGHEIIFAVVKNGGLVPQARKRGFVVHELSFKKNRAPSVLLQLNRILKTHKIDLVNTHSSTDAWMGGIAARLAGKKIIRTRHLSTPIKAGLNSRLLYKGLADFVVTTSSSIIPIICKQAGLARSLCRCVPTGVNPLQLAVSKEGIAKFRERIGVGPDDILVGTACFVRSWKGINDFMQAARLLKEVKNLKWVIVGGGYVSDYKEPAEKLGIMDVLTFTGHLDSPYEAIAAFDIFALLSTAHEGVSQASLQAAYLQRPLITTPIGGLPEVCLDGKTGVIVSPSAPQEVADAVSKLKDDPKLREKMGRNAKELVEEKFTFAHTLAQMEEVYKELGL
jgi:glycosyltransferase involved in cell wall biosynthesis